MASAYSDTIDIYREDSFRQKVVDWQKTLRIDIEGNRVNEDTTVIKALNLKNVVPWSARIVVKGKMVKASDGSALQAGRYKLEHGAAIWQSARLILNNEELEHCREPAITAAVNALVHKSAVQIERDAPKNNFYPLRQSKPGHLDCEMQVGSTLTNTLTYLNHEDSAYPDTFAEKVTNDTSADTVAIATTGVLTAAGAAAFGAAYVGQKIIVYSDSAAPYIGTIIARASDTSLTVAPAPAAAIAATPDWTVVSQSHNHPFSQGSKNGVTLDDNASSEFAFTVDMKDLFGSLNTDKLLPFANLEFILDKQTQWGRAIQKAGYLSTPALVPDAKFEVTAIFMLIDVIKPRDDAFSAEMKKMSDGTPLPMRFLKYGYEVVDSTGANVNVDLKVAGKRIKDLWVIPQMQAYANDQNYPSLMTGEYDLDHVAPLGAKGGWTHAALHIGDTTLPRHKSYRGYNELYVPEYEALRRCADHGESEGGCFITYEKFRNGYNWLYFDLSERSDEESLGHDHAPRLEITYELAALRRYHVIYTFEQASEFKVTDRSMEKGPSYVV